MKFKFKVQLLVEANNTESNMYEYTPEQIAKT
jgi:hypothetical protein